MLDNRFSDGTQVCYGTTTMSKSNISGVYYFEYFNQKYGAAFKSNDYYLTVGFIKNLNNNASQISSSSMTISLEKPGTSSSDQHSWRDNTGFYINKPAYNEYFPSSFKYYAIGKWK